MDAINKLLADYWLPINPKLRRALGFTFFSLLIVILALASLNNQPQKIDSVTGETQISFEAATVVVHVVGQVNKPGVYELPANSRVKDAIISAEGFSQKADQSSLNLARELIDGEQVVVGDGSKPLQLESTSKINLNKATAAELEKLPGIGPALAARIVDYRLANGSYRKIDDLSKVAGIGPKLLTRLKPEVTF